MTLAYLFRAGERRAVRQLAEHAAGVLHLMTPCFTKLETIAIDGPRGVAELSAAARAGGVVLDVLIEVDVGMSRGGTRMVEQSLDLARVVEEASGVWLRGIQAYEGHCMSETDRNRRTAMAHTAMSVAGEHLAALREAGYDAREVSGGGTGTYDITGRNPLVTELQAG